MTQTLQIKRTETPDLAPTGLAPGELSVELANPVKLWVGVPTVLDPSGRKLLASPVIISDLPPPVPYHGQLWWESDSGHLFLHYVDADTAQWVSIGGAPSKPTPPVDAYSKIESDLRYVELAGDTMTGHLFLNADPTAPMHAATKQYVDSASGSGITVGQGDIRYVLKAGDTMLGSLTIQMLHPNFVLDAAAGSVGSFITSKFTSLDRWSIRMPADFTGPGRFSIARFDDAGVDLGEPFIIDRQTGMVSAPQNWAVAPKDVVTLDYLQGYTTPVVPGQYVLKAGDLMTGSLTVNGEYLSINRASNPVEGLLYFGNTMLNYLHFNGTAFSFTHAASAPAITSWGTLSVAGASALTGVTNTGHFQNNGTLTASSTITTVGEFSTHGGIIRLNAAGDRYLWWDGTNFQTGIGYMWHSGNFNPAAYQPAGNYVPVAGGVIMTGILYHGSGSYYFNTDGTIVGSNITANGNLSATGQVFSAATYYMAGGAVYLTWDGASMAHSHHIAAPSAAINGALNVAGYTTSTGQTNNGGQANNGNFDQTGSFNLNGGMWSRGGRWDSSLPSMAMDGFLWNVTGHDVLPNGVKIINVVRGDPGWGDMCAIQFSNIPGTAAETSIVTGMTQSGGGVGVGRFSFNQNGKGYCVGGGPWLDYSDARIKDVIGDYTSGLAAIAALRPVRYRFKGNETQTGPSPYAIGMEPREIPGEEPEPRLPTPSVGPYPNSIHVSAANTGREFIGLLAQETEVVMPELITQRNGFIDNEPVTDLREMDSGPILFALINAVRELKAEVDALKAQLNPARR